MVSAKIIAFSLVFFASALGGFCDTCTNPVSSTEDAESTSGECLLQNAVKSTVKTEEMELEEEAVAGESEEQEAVEEVDQDGEDLDVDQDPAVPKCTAKDDCKPREGGPTALDCVGGVCIDSASLKYKWTLATVDKKCPGSSIGNTGKGKKEIMDCKQACQKTPGCTGFNRGKKGAIEARCWFFNSCTKDTPKGKLATSTMHNVYFVTANADVEIATTVVDKKTVKVLGLSQTQATEQEQPADQVDQEQSDEADLDSFQDQDNVSLAQTEEHEEAETASETEAEEDDSALEEAAQDPALPKCTTAADCKGEGQGCAGGVCIVAATLKYKWTLADVDKKCPGRSIGNTGKGKKEIMDCKQACQKTPGCTGFNRGKKGAIEARCWFFDSCTKDTPKGKLASSTMHNVYFVSATAEVDLTKTTYTKKNMKVLGLGQQQTEAETEHEPEAESVALAHTGQDPPKCTAKADCKGEGQDCVGGICINAATLKYKWTLATVDKKCSGKSIGNTGKGKKEIMDCKQACQKTPGCTGFNRGKKGAIEARCWFFDSCTKDTPKGKLASSTMHNVYFVSAEAEVDIVTITMVPKETVTKKKMKVLG